MKKLSTTTRIMALVIVGLLGQNALAMGQKAPKPRESDPAWVVQGVVGQQQEKQQWCWAAISRAVLSTKMKNLPSQCEIVSRTVGLDCCRPNQMNACKDPNYPHLALEKYGVDVTARSPKYQQVVNALKKKQLVMISHASGSSEITGAHLVLAYGTYLQDGVHYLLVYEPYSGKSTQWTEKNFSASAYSVFYVH